MRVKTVIKKNVIASRHIKMEKISLPVDVDGCNAEVFTGI